MNIYSIRDLKADAFAAPFCLPNDAVALRATAEAANDPETTLFKHPGDFQLWYVGKFDQSTGHLEVNPSLVCNITSLQQKKE